jgi:hypothetical protein
MSRTKNELMRRSTTTGKAIGTGEMVTGKACIPELDANGMEVRYNNYPFTVEVFNVVESTLRQMVNAYDIAHLQATDRDAQKVVELRGVAGIVTRLGTKWSRSSTGTMQRLGGTKLTANSAEIFLWCAIAWPRIEDGKKVSSLEMTLCSVSLAMSNGGHDGFDTTVSCVWRCYDPTTGTIHHLTTPKANGFTFTAHCGCTRTMRGYIGECLTLAHVAHSDLPSERVELVPAGDLAGIASARIIDAIASIRNGVNGGTLNQAKNACSYQDRHAVLAPVSLSVLI